MKSINAISLVLATSILLSVTPTTVSADQWHRGNIREFHTHDFHAWREGELGIMDTTAVD